MEVQYPWVILWDAVARAYWLPLFIFYKKIKHSMVLLQFVTGEVVLVQWSLKVASLF
jgi:RNAse (barnase) inhibitor barstar